MKRKIVTDNPTNTKKRKISQSFLFNHVKIWFPKRDTHPLGGIINEMRLIRQKELYAFRGEQLLLLTDFQNNEFRDKAYVEDFCKKQGIGLITTDYVKKELRDKAWKDCQIQHKLFEIAMMELQDPDGLVVIASDIFRILSPVLALGAYSDIDEKIVVDGDSEEIPELVLNISIERIEGTIRLRSCNNFIYARDPDHQILLTHRKNIFKKYTNSNTLFHSKMFTKAAIFKEPFLVDQIILKVFHDLARAFQLIPDSIKNPILFRKALKENYPQHIDLYCYFYVLSCSGPSALRDTLLFGETLDIAQISSWSIDLTNLKLTSENRSNHSDVSWNTKGRIKVQEETCRIVNAALNVQRFWRRRKENSVTDSAIENPIQTWR